MERRIFGLALSMTRTPISCLLVYKGGVMANVPGGDIGKCAGTAKTSIDRQIAQSQLNHLIQLLDYQVKCS